MQANRRLSGSKADEKKKPPTGKPECTESIQKVNESRKRRNISEKSTTREVPESNHLKPSQTGFENKDISCDLSQISQSVQPNNTEDKQCEMVVRFKHLTEVPSNILHAKIKLLDLSHNKLAKLPKDMFYQLPSLTKLNLDYNELQFLPLLSDKTRAVSCLQHLTTFSATNNKLVHFPMQLFVNEQKGAKQSGLVCIQLNDNEIQKVPEEIKHLSNLKILHLHKNPLVELPFSMSLIWGSLQEFSIDWFSYLVPFVGRIIKPSKTEENQAYTLSSSKKNKSFIQQVNMGPQKQTQKERSTNVYERFKYMLDVLQRNSSAKEFSFCEFLAYFMKKNENENLAEVVKNIKYPPTYRPLLHQLAEDNSSAMFKDAYHFIVSNTPSSNQTPIDINLADSEDQTCLLIALKHKHVDIAKFILKVFNDKVDLNYSSKKPKESPTHLIPRSINPRFRDHRPTDEPHSGDL